jgi:hypothetical protein
MGERSQSQTWGSGRAPTYYESQQRQQFYTATANIVQLPPVSPMQHPPRQLHVPMRHNSDAAFGLAPAVLNFDESNHVGMTTLHRDTPLYVSEHGDSNDHLHSSVSSLPTAPADHAWDIASSNANRLMAKLSHLKNTIRTVRERTGEADIPTLSEMQAPATTTALPQNVWHGDHQLAFTVNHSEPHPPPSPLPPAAAADEVSPAYVSNQKLHYALPSPPAVYSPSHQLPFTSSTLVAVHNSPDSRSAAHSHVQRPYLLQSRDTPLSGALAVQQPSPELPEVDTNLKRYISSLEERVTALTFENNKLKSSNESMHMTIKSMSEAAQGSHVNDSALWQQQQQQQQQQQHLRQALEQRVSSLQRQSELVQVFDAACVKQSELIGDGSFGQVRMGQLTLPVAVKTARRQNQGAAAASETARETSLKQEEQIFREASLQGALRHPGVVASLGICVTQGGQVALITELVKGRSLEDILHTKKITLSMQETITIAIQLADALAYLHHRSVVHRDVKPGNILVSSDMIVKLCDFGLACRFSVLRAPI